MNHVRNLTLIFLLAGAGAAYWATRPDVAQLPLSATEGVKPEIGEGRPQKNPDGCRGRCRALAKR